MKTSSSISKHVLSPLSLAIVAAMPAALTADENKQDNYTTLDSVVVTATKTEHEVATAPASISVITSEQLKEMPVSDISDAIRHSVGVFQVKNGNGRQGIGIRGLGSAYTLILVNGRRVNSVNTLIRGNDFDLSTIPLNQIERIEVVRGPMSSLYGSEALGGVVNIITKQADNQWGGQVSVDYATPEGSGSDDGNETRTSISTSGALIEDKLFLSFHGNKYDRDAWTPFQEDYTTTTINERDETGLEDRNSTNANLGLTWKLTDNQTVDFEYGYGHEDRKSNFEFKGSNGITDHETRRDTYSLTHKGDWGWGNSQIRYYQEETEFKERSTTVPNGDATQTNQVVDGFITTQFGDHAITTGAEYRTSELDNDVNLKTTGSADVSQKALYIQDEWKLSQDWALTGGGRLDDHEFFGREFSPRGYLVYTPTEALTIKGGVGIAFKAPTLTQLTKEYSIPSCRGRCTLIGNPDLQPEKSTSYELGFTYQGNSWDLGATVFRTDIKDMIARQSEKDENNKKRDIITYENINKARIDGIELTGSVDLTDSVFLTANYSYTDARDRDTDNRLATTPRENVNVRLDWEVDSKLGTFTQARCIGDQKTRGNDNLPGYSLVDVGVTYQLTEQVNLRSGITNLADTRLDKKDDNFDFVERGRTFYAGFTASF
ncbi:TonB-dependent receptor domain-containing protein [Spartinivicinus poritis]|uniref:TonB-dependent receptor n=1 Tax=Spartinivicinus poritis TaxID=2994640 RepID=A0ABT5U2W6_9GAMM|nr:TonB-dependent receptor [Spartinivicinus sp. A2-2]MDE1460701.1 TonB-dependent receptor [Spartinivicinus sp. A2-2]